MNLKIFLEELQDHLAPSLDIYELTIYLYIFRHTRLLGNQEGIIGFKSARNQMSYGRPKGEGRARMSDYTCMTKLKSLEQKGFVKILGTERTGTRVQLFLPSEIPNLIPNPLQESELDLEEMGRVVPEIGNPNIRELIIYSYRLIYEVSSGRVIILAVIHCKQNFTGDFEELRK